MRIIIDINVAKAECERCRQQRQQLQNFLTQIQQVMRTLTTISWVSPAAKALWTKFSALVLVIERALRIVDQYIQDLERVIEEFMRAERMTGSRIESLSTNDVFNA